MYIASYFTSDLGSGIRSHVDVPAMHMQVDMRTIRAVFYIIRYVSAVAAITAHNRCGPLKFTSLGFAARVSRRQSD